MVTAPYRLEGLRSLCKTAKILECASLRTHERVAMQTVSDVPFICVNSHMADENALSLSLSLPLSLLCAAPPSDAKALGAA